MSLRPVTTSEEFLAAILGELQSLSEQVRLLGDRLAQERERSSAMGTAPRGEVALQEPEAPKKPRRKR